MVLFDYRKAFDLIHHALLARKLLALACRLTYRCFGSSISLQIARRESSWEKIAFLNGETYRQGLPQGTKPGQWLFILMIDDINTSNTELWKYVDDTTIAECVDKKEDSRIQSDVEELIGKSNQNKFQLNESKCKELRISFAKSAADFAPIVINGKAIEVVSTVKLLGLNI